MGSKKAAVRSKSAQTKPTAKRPAAKKAAKPAPKKAAGKRPAAKKLAPKQAAKPAPKKPASKKPAPKKPAPTTGKLVFPDVGFHLAVLGALLDGESIAESTLEAALEGIDGDASEMERLHEAMRRLHAIGMDPTAVAAIESIDFDGGNEIYMLMERGADVYTGGEDDTYSLRSIAGIDALTGLERLDLDGHGYREETLDLAPLQGHPTLASITLTGTCSNATALESLPRLAQVSGLEDAAVERRLAARGVVVD